MSVTLHEAIEQLLRQTGRSMTTTEIANALNKTKAYTKKDGSAITPYQIHGRTKNYPQLFNRRSTLVSLNVQPITIVAKPIKVAVTSKPMLTEKPQDPSLLEKVLMDEANFKSAAVIDNIVPHSPGIYCIRIKDVKKLPKPFDGLLQERNHNIIYIGIASQSLNKRFLNQELRANGHGTFFRSIGAVLGYKPIKGSLLTKANKRNYTFSAADNAKIIEWINRNLTISWVSYQGNLEIFETTLIQKYLPILNLAKNPAALKHLSDLRAECVRVANS